MGTMEKGVNAIAGGTDNGYGDNVWVDLTDVELLPKRVVQTRKGTISAVWVAALPQGVIAAGAPRVPTPGS